MIFRLPTRTQDRDLTVSACHNHCPRHDYWLGGRVSHRACTPHTGQGGAGAWTDRAITKHDHRRIAACPRGERHHVLASK